MPGFRAHLARPMSSLQAKTTPEEVKIQQGDTMKDAEMEAHGCKPCRWVDSCPGAVQTQHNSLLTPTQLHRSLAGGDKDLRSTDRGFAPQRGRFCSFGEGS